MPWKYKGTVSIAGRTITSLCFDYDIDGLAGEEEVAKLVQHLDEASTACGMKINAENTMLMTTPVASTQRPKVNGQKLKTVPNCN